MASTVQGPGQTVITLEQFYYSNKNIAGTAINAQIKPGYVMCFDRANAVDGRTLANSLGWGVHKPETGNLTLFAGVVWDVTGLPTTSGGIVNGAAGYITLATKGIVRAWTHADMDNPDDICLMTANGDWGLIASTGIASIAAIMQHVAVAMTDIDTGTTAGYATVCLKGPGKI